MKFLVFSLLISIILFQPNMQGKEIKLKNKFGDDVLLLPRQIVWYEEELFVLDEGDKSIKIFSKDEKLKEKFGRKGAGPGEFISTRGFCIHANMIYVLDAWQQKFHLFSKNDKKYLTSKRYSLFELNFQPYDFVISENGFIFYTTSTFTRGGKLIVKLDGDFKPVKGLLDCIPVYNKIEEIYNAKSSAKNYLNKGYITLFGNKIYFTYWLLNKVIELSQNGAVLNEYTLPIDSIDKKVKITKQAGTGFARLERRLNYDILGKANGLYVLSRDENGDSVIFRLINGKFVEAFRIKEQVYGFDILGDKLYGIEKDDSVILVYDLK